MMGVTLYMTYSVVGYDYQPTVAVWVIEKWMKMEMLVLTHLGHMERFYERN